MSITKVTTVALLATLAACTSSDGSDPAADSRPEAANAPAQIAQESPPATGPIAPATESPGVKVFVDPTTGQIRQPTREEAAALESEIRKRAPGVKRGARQQPQEIVHPDGSVEFILDESYEQALKACVQADGSIKMTHKCDPPREDSKDVHR